LKFAYWTGLTKFSSSIAKKEIEKLDKEVQIGNQRQEPEKKVLVEKKGSH